MQYLLGKYSAFVSLANPGNSGFAVIRNDTYFMQI